MHGPNSRREFLDGYKSQFFVQIHCSGVAGRDGERNRVEPTRPQRLHGGFHHAAAQPASLVAGHGADLRGVADVFRNARSQNDAGNMAGMGRPQNE